MYDFDFIITMLLLGDMLTQVTIINPYFSLMVSITLLFLVRLDDNLVLLHGIFVLCAVFEDVVMLLSNLHSVASYINGSQGIDEFHLS